MEKNINNQMLDKLTKICLCKMISRATIKKAIKDGAKTLEAVQQVTGAGSGGCRGHRCTPMIEEILKKEAEKENLKE